MASLPRAGAVAALLLAAVLACSDDGPNTTPAALTLLSGDQQIGRAGDPLLAPLLVAVTDRHGDPVAGVAVDFRLTAGGGTVNPATATTDALGHAATSWTVDTVRGGPDTVTATVRVLPSAAVHFSATVAAGVAVTITLVGGDQQTAEVGTVLANPVVVEARDRYGNPVDGQPMSWQVDSGRGSVPADTTLTDALGRAATAWTVGHRLGAASQRLTAALDGQQLTLSASTTLTTATLELVFGDGQLGFPDSLLPAPLVIRVSAADGIGVEGASPLWQATSGQLGGITPTDSLGRSEAHWTLGSAAGSQGGQVSLAAAASPVSFTATAVVPTPGSITGSITMSPPSLTFARAPRGGAVPVGPLRSGYLGDGAGSPRSGVPTVSSEELLVTFRSSAAGLQGIRRLGQVALARSAAAGMRSALARHLRPGRVELTGVSPLIRAARLHLADPRDLDSVAATVRRNPAVLAVIPMPRARADRVTGARSGSLLPDDPNYPNQSWHYVMVDLPRAWAITTGSAGVIVAVLDNGVRFDHPALGVAGGSYLTGGGNLRNDGYDFVTPHPVALCAGGSTDNADDLGDGVGDGYDPDPSIPDERVDGGNCLGDRDSLGGHGLHVAGTIGARGNDGYSVAGVNWSVGIRPVRVLGLFDGSYYDIAQGVLYAAGLPADDGHGGLLPPLAQPARIINLSLGGPCVAGGSPPAGTDPLHDAIVAVTDSAPAGQAALVVVSAGNSASSQPPCPAAYPQVLAVGAVGPSGARASYSNFGSWVALAAPGGEVAAPDATFWVYSSVCNFAVYPAPCIPRQARLVGTSMAAPHVSGIAALLLAQNPGLTAAGLRSRLTSFAVPGAPGDQIGAGIVNARNALTQSLTISRSIVVQAIDSATGLVAGSAVASGGVYTISGLPPGRYYVQAGEDESGDGVIGTPDRRFGVLGGVAAPSTAAVTAAAGALASFTIDLPAEREPNDLPAAANRLPLGGSLRATLDAADPVDHFRVLVPVAGSYTFETAGWLGDRCSFALDLNTTLELLDAGQGVLATSVDIDPAVNDYCSRITATLSPGTYTLRVTRGDFFGFGPHSGRYTLSARAGP